MKLRTRLKDMGGSALIAFMMSYSLSCVLLGAVSADFSRPLTALCCAAAVLVCALAALNRVTALAAVGVAAAGVAVLAILRVNPLAPLRRVGVAVAAFFGGKPMDLRGELLTVTVCLCVLFGVASMLMARLSGGVYPAILLFVSVVLSSWYIALTLPQLALVPGLIALAVLYARAFRESGGTLRALPAALIAAVVAVLLMPSAPVVWPPLQDAADKVRELVNDYFMFNEPRIVYSVSSDGYQPQVDRLGGPATPRHEDVMLVKTDASLLLRGSVSRSYTGRNWMDEAVNSRYLFIDPTRLARRNAAFDADISERLGKNVRKVQAEILFLGEGTSTLFVPHRLTDLTARLDMPVYYNETGEVFITRGVEPGDTYVLEAWIPDGDWTALAAAIEAAAGERDPDWADVCAEYLSLPSHIEANLYWLVMELTEEIESPVRKALAIRDYLTSASFVYDLNGAYPPEGRDFVSWFVLREKRGYCTYYASAMAVMARLAGIPARYAEGYRALSDGTGETLVTGEDAHAWAELYFSGVGWIAFDATPGEDGTQPGDSGGNGGETPPDTTPTPAPQTQATPEPTGETAPDGGADAQPSPTPEPDDGGEEGKQDSAPEPSPEPSPEPGPDSQTQPDKTPRRGPRWLLIALALLLVLLSALLLARRRYVRTSPKYLASREKDARVRLMIWYRASLALLERNGLAPEGGESPVAFAARVVQMDGVPPELARLARVIGEAQYAGHVPDKRALAAGEIVYEALLRRMTRRQRFGWHLSRMLHGIGDYARIP
ncbi:MAG: DUF4129 domain-containing protein [Clostridia bacterium]|nr:DUF4129 domain-containing protein [Clostridia bacterium]